MNVFITGATRFIGGRTVRRLMQSGHRCICLVRKRSKNSDSTPAFPFANQRGFPEGCFKAVNLLGPRAQPLERTRRT